MHIYFKKLILLTTVILFITSDLYPSNKEFSSSTSISATRLSCSIGKLPLDDDEVEKK